MRGDSADDHQDDRQVDQVEAVGGVAEHPQRPGGQQPDESGGLAGGDGGDQHRHGGGDGEVDPEVVVHGPDGALDETERHDGQGGQDGEPPPRQPPDALRRDDDARPHHTRDEHGGEMRGEPVVALDRVGAGGQQPAGDHRERHTGDGDGRAEPAPDEKDQREQEIQLGLHPDRPERAVRGRGEEHVLEDKAVDENRRAGGRAVVRGRDHVQRDGEAHGQRGPVRREDAPGASAQEPTDSAGPPAVPGRGDGEREAGQHQEEDDGEAAEHQHVQDPRRRTVGVPREGVQPAVEQHHIQRGQPAEAVQPQHLPTHGCAARPHFH